MANKTKKKSAVNKAALRRLVGAMSGMPADWRNAKYYVQSEVESSQYAKPLTDYIKKNYTKEEQRLVSYFPSYALKMYSHYSCAAYRVLNNMDVPLEYKAALSKYVDNLMHEAAEARLSKQASTSLSDRLHQPTIQERILEKSIDVCEEIDNWLDKGEELDVKSHLELSEISQAHARKIIGFYDDEFKELSHYLTLKSRNLSDDDEQLKEAYSSSAKKDIKARVKMLQELIDQLNMIIAKAKINRKPVVRKAPSKEKLVEKLKYKKEDDDLKLVSVDPSDIIGAGELWIYNTKTKKMGVYYADGSTPLGVKGTSILGYNEHTSIQKTLRKPAEMIKEMMKLSKAKRSKYMPSLTTKESKLTGRINADTILLKIQH